MTGDRQDERAAMDFSMIMIMISDTVMISMNFNSYASLVIFWSSFLFCSVLFLNTELCILYECSLCLIFITVRKLAI